MIQHHLEHMILLLTYYQVDCNLTMPFIHLIHHMGTESSNIISSLRMHSCTFITVCMYVCIIFFFATVWSVEILVPPPETELWPWAVSGVLTTELPGYCILYILYCILHIVHILHIVFSTYFNHVQYLFMWLLILFHILANIFTFWWYINFLKYSYSQQISVLIRAMISSL